MLPLKTYFRKIWNLSYYYSLCRQWNCALNFGEELNITPSPPGHPKGEGNEATCGSTSFRVLGALPVTLAGYLGDTDQASYLYDLPYLSCAAHSLTLFRTQYGHFRWDSKSEMGRIVRVFLLRHTHVNRSFILNSGVPWDAYFRWKSQILRIMGW